MNLKDYKGRNKDTEDIQEIFINGKKFIKRKIILNGEDQTVLVTSESLSKKDIKDIKNYWRKENK